MRRAAVLATALAATAPDIAVAEPGAHTWAVIIGSNRPGPGQAPLRYADADARRVAAVFTELGDVPDDQVIELIDPGPSEVLTALDQVSEALQQAPETRRTVLFYYSGHARAGGLDLGEQPLGLPELRARLETLPADLRLVVLDACQSGSISQAKGLSPTAAFSTASVQGLDAEGTVVIASSAADELSQESDEVEGSYFTHHLVVALRGAADTDYDGVVTLDEAYRYAYDHTVVSTATTAIGRQHPSLETDLRGRGAVALTRPAGATARLRLGGEDAGEILLVHADSGVVSAELDKVTGDALTLALPPGAYDVVWTRDGDAQRCHQQLPDGELVDFAPADCRAVAPEVAVAKGGLGAGLYETAFLEVGIGPWFGPGDTAFTERLATFGYEATSEPPLRKPVATTSVTLHRHLAAIGTASKLDSQQWARRDRITVDDVSYRFDAWRFGLGLRAKLPMFAEWVVPYVQASGGPTQVTDDFAGGDDAPARWGLHGAAGGGLQLMPRFGRDTRVVGLFAQVEVSRSTGLANLYDDRHELGGLHPIVGLRGGM